MTRSEVQQALGDPDDWSVALLPNRLPRIWKYGDVEVCFSKHDKVKLIFMDDFREGAPRGEPSLQIEPSRFVYGASKSSIEEVLAQEKVQFTVVEPSGLTGSYMLRTEAGVDLCFKKADEWSEFTGLYAISLEAR